MLVKHLNQEKVISLKSFYITDPGKVRSHNEDSVTIIKNKADEHLMVVADGMGGHRAGEVASSMVVTYLGERFKNLSTIGGYVDAVNWLRDSVEEINSNIIKYTKENPDSTGMGTTIVLALLTDKFLLFLNIGDSAGYVIRNNKLYKVTKEHTLPNFLVETGELTKEEALNHPKRNVLMKALGTFEKTEPDIIKIESNVEGILLASDGLTHMISDSQIENTILDDTLTHENKLIMLINKANARGGTDNISVAYLVKEGGIFSDN